MSADAPNDPLAELAAAAAQPRPPSGPRAAPAHVQPLKMPAWKALLWPGIGYGLAALWVASRLAARLAGRVALPLWPLLPVAIGLFVAGAIVNFVYLRRARPLKRRGYQVQGTGFAWAGFILSMLPLAWQALEWTILFVLMIAV